MTDPVNGYTTLDVIKRDKRIQATSIDEMDDEMITDLITQASRYIDSETNHTFYARTETHYYSVPRNYSRRLVINDDDLLTVASVTNGNGDIIPVENYNLEPYNKTPKVAIVLKWSQSSSPFWMPDNRGNMEAVIQVAGTWGYATTAPADIEMACREIVINCYQNRFGQQNMAVAQITAAGVVLTPQDIPQMALRIISKYTRLVYA